MSRDYSEIKKATKSEQSGIEKVSETGTKETKSHKTLEKDLEDETALIKKQIDKLEHLIHSTISSRDHWLTKAKNLHQSLLSIMKLDKVNICIYIFILRIYLY